MRAAWSGNRQQVAFELSVLLPVPFNSKFSLHAASRTMGTIIKRPAYEVRLHRIIQPQHTAEEETGESASREAADVKGKECTKLSLAAFNKRCQ